MTSPASVTPLVTEDSPTVLIADDDPLSRRILQNFLAPHYNLVTCQDGTAAWDRICHAASEKEPIDLILLDHEMPGFNGLELLSKVITAGLDVPVLLISAAEEGRSSGADTALALGSEDYLVKPFVKSILLRRVERALDRQHTRDLQLAYESYRVEMESRLREMASLEEEVNQTRDMASRAVHALEVPIIGISRTLSAVLQNPTLRDNPIKDQLESVLKAMMSDNIYEPILKRIQEREIDPIASSLLEQYVAAGPTAVDMRLLDATQMHPVPESLKLSVQELGLARWDWTPPPDFSELHMEHLIHSMFLYICSTDEGLNIDDVKLRRFVSEIHGQYLDNPYHNFRHAFDVTRTTFSLLVEFDVMDKLSSLETLSILIAALCHDVGHPGRNNKYLVATSDEIAITYNDQSVLENYHCARTFRTLNKPETNFLEHLSAEQRTALRQIVIGCIMRTDMAVHFTLTGKMLQRKGDYDYDNAADRQLILEIILHAADISNVAKPWETAREWSTLVAEEFFAQGDLEKQQGIPCEPFMDRTKASLEAISRNFINFVCLEFFELFVTVIPKARSIMNQLQLNLKKWEELDELKKKEKE